MQSLADVYKDGFGTLICPTPTLISSQTKTKGHPDIQSSPTAMLTSLFSLSTLLLLKCLTSPATGVPVSQDESDDALTRGGIPYIPQGPQAPPRPCDEEGCRDPAIQLSQDDVFPGQDIFLIVFGRPGRIQSSPGKDISTILTSYVEDSLPYFLKQLTPVPKDIPAAVKEGAPLIVSAVLDFSQRKDAKNAQKLKAWTKKVYGKAPCDLFAASTLPPLEAALDAVYFANNPTQEFEYGQKQISHDLDYFIRPAYGPIATRDGVTIRYNSKFPAFQNGVNVVNHARDVFVRGPDDSQYRSTPAGPGHIEFKRLVQTLLYQFGHVAQWATVDYLDDEIDLKYLLGYCKVCHPAQALIQRAIFHSVTNPILYRLVIAIKRISMSLRLAKTRTRLTSFSTTLSANNFSKSGPSLNFMASWAFRQRRISVHKVIPIQSIP